MIGYRILKLRSAVGELRIAKFNERDHFVVPTTMLVEGVVFAMNAEAPEFVPRSELARSPAGWNGRPVVGGHPMMHGRAVSANDPRVLESNQFGTVFNTEFHEDRLLCEAWIDPARAEQTKIGQSVVRRLQAGEPIEVSVGVFVNFEERKGEFKGKAYSLVWREAVPDHLAFLDEGDVGACSNDMGCGVNVMRAAAAHVVTPEGIDMPAQTDTNETPRRSFRERFLSLLRFRTAAGEEDMSDVQLRQTLDSVLAKTVAGFMGINSVFPADKSVVYGVMFADTIKTFRQSYTVNEDLTVELSGEAEEVAAVTRYEPVTAAEGEVRAACGCGGDKKVASAAEKKAAPTAENTGAQSMNKEARVKALAQRSKLTEKFLSGLSDDQLAEIETQFPEQATPAPAPQAAQEAPQTVDQVLAGIKDPAVRDAMQEGIRAAQEKRTNAITALKATGRCAWTDAELAAMTLGELDRLVKLATVPVVEQEKEPVNFAARGVPRALKADEMEVPPASQNSLASMFGKKQQKAS